ncbi:MAG TPA: hypothetical protein VFT29_15090, partial [Gemmatimonadaceae bacterium]|nr:hypothetical protein [Gemmatimonadaceae bacterium]
AMRTSGIIDSRRSLRTRVATPPFIARVASDWSPRRRSMRVIEAWHGLAHSREQWRLGLHGMLLPRDQDALECSQRALLPVVHVGCPE